MYGHGNFFPQWLHQHGVAHAKDMKFKRHSTSRNDIQFENCAVLILVWDHLLEFLNLQVGGRTIYIATLELTDHLEYLEQHVVDDSAWSLLVCGRRG